jgi:hypothetical protein
MTVAPDTAAADSLTWLRDDAEWAEIRACLRSEVQASPEPLPSIEELRARGDYYFMSPLPDEPWEYFHQRVRTEEALLAWLVARFSP